MSVKQRLIDYLIFKGENKSVFGRKIGVSTAYIASIRKSIQPDKVERIALNYPDLNITWLLTGQGEMLKTAERNNQESNTFANNKSPENPEHGDRISSGKIIPFYDAEAAAGTEYGMDMTPAKPVGLIEIGGFLKDSQSALRVYGNSMTPSYPPGCIVGLKPHNDSFIEPGNVYVIETADNRYLKRLYYNGDKTAFVCSSDNSMIYESGPRKGTFFYPEFEVPFSDVKSLFRVVGVIKRNVI